MKRDRTEICNIISHMLDNPDPSGIYPTSTAYARLEMYVMQERFQCLGWMYAYACIALDEGKELRTMDIPDIIKAMQDDIEEIPDE